MSSALASSVRAWVREPAIPDPPTRVWRDWILVAVASTVALAEAVFRVDDEWVDLSAGWRTAAVIVFFATTPAALLVRRTHPLAATAASFGVAIAFGVATALAEGSFGGLSAMAVMLVVPYALYRWGSGRDGLIGGGILGAALIIGNLTTPDAALGEWIGGFIVLTIPVQLGLLVRYRSAAGDRAGREAQARERESLARELHDTVAHYVSAIAVQAQGARAVADTDPERAIGVLAVIEDQALRTLAEMRTIVGTLRNGATPDLTPQPGVADLPHLADQVADRLTVTVDVDDAARNIGHAVDTAVFRIAQESLTNATRHARGATRVDVSVRTDGDGLRLAVVDDGRPTARAEHGYGLMGMAERTHLLGGVFDAGPVPGGGWCVTATFPPSATDGTVAPTTSSETAP